MIAALPMYDHSWLHPAHDRLWNLIRDRLKARGIEAPQRLTRDRDISVVWNDPGLLFGQTCGYPFWKALRRKVEVLAAPIYGFQGCTGPNHCSFLVAHRDNPRKTLAEFRGDKAAVNSGDSNTGTNLFRAAVAPLADGKPFFADVIVTGGHAWSIYAIVEGRADIAAIDCVTYGLLAAGAPQLLAQVKVIGETVASPALPFITSRALPPQTRAAVRQVLMELPPVPELGLTSVAFLPESAYARIDEIEREAAEAGYPVLA